MLFLQLYDQRTAPEGVDEVTRLFPLPFGSSHYPAPEGKYHSSITYVVEFVDIKDRDQMILIGDKDSAYILNEAGKTIQTIFKPIKGVFK